MTLKAIEGDQRFGKDRSETRHPMTDRQAALMRLDIILPMIRAHTKDARHLHVAARIAL